MCDKSAPKKFPLPYALLNCPIRFNPFQYDAYRCYWEENKKNILEYNYNLAQLNYIFCVCFL